MKKLGQELPADVAKASKFDMKGTVWVTKADFLMRKEEMVVTTSIPGSPTVNIKVTALFLEYDKPASIEAPPSAETLPFPSPT